MSRKQQSNAYHKQRKAKARAKHQAEYGQWDKRLKAKVKARSLTPPMHHMFGGAHLSIASFEALMDRWEKQDEVNRFIFETAYVLKAPPHDS